MMLKIRKRSYKLLGAITCGLLLGLSYFGLSFYSIPEKANAKVWFPSEGTGLKDIVTMQSMTPEICRDSEIGDGNSLVDARDNNAYTVKKLADGKCWMTQNLRLTQASIQAKTPENTTGLITPANSNISADYLLPVATTTAFNGTQVSGSYPNEQVRVGANETYGVYYSWCAATAKTCMNGTTPIPGGEDATSSICPKGWRLPTGGANGDYYTLYHTGSVKTGNFVANSTTSGYNLGNNNNGQSGMAFFPAAGYVTSSSLDNVGTYGYYWTSTAESIANAHLLYFNGSTISPGYAAARYIGRSVRCVADASEDVKHTDFSTGDITVLVAKMLTLDATTNMTKLVDITEVTTGEISATVSANSAYQVLLSAEEPDLTSANSANTAVISASPDVRAGVTNAWGILDHDGESYDAITTRHEQYHDEKENLGNGSIKHIYKIGISISPTLPADTYSTSVTITVAAI